MHCTVHLGWRGEGTEGRHLDIPQIVESSLQILESEFVLAAWCSQSLEPTTLV